MSVLVTPDALGKGGTIRRAVRSVAITVPASRRARAATLADACRIYSLDVSDDERAERIRKRDG